MSEPTLVECVRKFVAENPACLAQEVAAALGFECRTVSPVLKALTTAGVLRVNEKQTRGRRYTLIA
jgi:predicted transcriptional regulator